MDRPLVGTAMSFLGNGIFVIITYPSSKCSCSHATKTENGALVRSRCPCQRFGDRKRLESLEYDCGRWRLLRVQRWLSVRLRLRLRLRPTAMATVATATATA